MLKERPHSRKFTSGGATCGTDVLPWHWPGAPLLLSLMLRQCYLMHVADVLCQVTVVAHLWIVDAALQCILAEQRDANVLRRVYHLPYQP